METKKQNQGWLILGGIALLLLVFFIYQNYTDKQHDWKMDFEEESQEPYGTFVIKEILEQVVAKDSFIVLDKKIAEDLPNNPDKPSSFVFIGEALLLDSSDVEQLLDFVDNGNTAFISSLTIPDLLMDEVFLPPCDTLYWEDYSVYYDTAVITNFVHPDLQDSTNFVFPYVKNQLILNNYWQQLPPYVFCTEENYPTIISQSPDSTVVDMALFPYGAGAFYLQTSPIAFTNLYQTKKQGQVYSEKVITHLQTETIYWDEFSNVPVAIGRNKNWANNDPLTPKEGPLDYILSQPPLAWAWYLLLSLGLLYLLFRAKRRQRMIPVLAQNKNTSLAFISTIGRLHFTGKNHRRIALQQMDLLERFIRAKYKLSAQDKTEAFIKDLSRITEIEETLLAKMFLIHKNIKSSKFTTDKTLIELHKLTDYFYKNCR
ncbi:MAG: hypothetical protein AB8G86_04470 [Saprospiraceae bacterium]